MYPKWQSDRCRIAELTAEVERLREQNKLLWNVAEIAEIIAQKWGGTYSTDLLAALAAIDPQTKETDDE